MSKAFTKESDGDDDDDAAGLPPLPPGGKNYITPAGHARLRAVFELRILAGLVETRGELIPNLGIGHDHDFGFEFANLLEQEIDVGASDQRVDLIGVAIAAHNIQSAGPNGPGGA